MPELNHSVKTMEALSQSSIHQSLSTPTSQVAFARAQSSTLNDPSQAMDLLRSVLQPAINEEIRKVLQTYSDLYFTPGMKNAVANLGKDKVSDRLVDDVCISALEHAKSIYVKADKVKKSKKSKRKRQDDQPLYLDKRGRNEVPVQPKAPRPYTDLILVSKTGKPVRREGPKWDSERLRPDTLFILGSKANKGLGFGQTRGRLYIKHPELFKYSGDQEDKEWLAKNEVMATTGGKAYLMLLADILDLSETADYASHPRQQRSELVGFTVPPFMLTKMKCFMAAVRTDPTCPDEELVSRGEVQVARWEEDRKKLVSSSFNTATALAFKDSGDEVQKILDEMKKEHANAGTSEEDELGFLHGMNLTNLVRELEMEAVSGNGSQHLGILSLADDNAEEVFPELPEEIEEADSSGKKDTEGRTPVNDHSGQPLQASHENETKDS